MDIIRQRLIAMAYADAPGNGTSTSAGRQHPKKQLILNAFIESCSGHQSPGLWRHPDDRSDEFNDIEHWVNLAKLLESAKIHGNFIADVLGARLKDVSFRLELTALRRL